MSPQSSSSVNMFGSPATFATPSSNYLGKRTLSTMIAEETDDASALGGRPAKQARRTNSANNV
jgi:hypothetical protein